MMKDRTANIGIALICLGVFLVVTVAILLITLADENGDLTDNEAEIATVVFGVGGLMIISTLVSLNLIDERNRRIRWGY